MPSLAVRSADPRRVLTIIMGGGRGTRLFPLTRERAKPAVPLAGKYRLVDVPLSNSINSEMRRIFVLTQFLSASLHRHVYGSFKFDQFTDGFVEILAAEQSHTDISWYQGTADAVRKNLVHFRTVDFDYALILSGDQLYRMDFRTLLDQHVRAGAEITVATVPVSREAAPGLGIMQINAERRIVRYVEKPAEPALLDGLRLERESYASLGIEDDRELFLASMGIYLFNRDLLFRLLDNDLADFGRHIIPAAIAERRVFSSIFQGYWEDIGTIRSFYQANLDLAAELPRFNLFDMMAPIYTRARFLPPSKINGAAIEQSIISEGCILNHCQIAHSIVGLRSVVDRDSEITDTILMGADSYESAEGLRRDTSPDLPPIGIGKSTRIEGAIVDKNARIGDGCVVRSAGKPDTLDHPLYYVRDGIVIIPKGAVIPDGTLI
jgi:glucose-1-phosphate adenylyltransferase